MSELTKEVVLKYFLRFTHMFTVISLSGKIIYEYLFQNAEQLSLPSYSGQTAFYVTLGILLIISGFINMFILNPKQNMKENKGPWMKVLYLKFILSIFACTPLPRAFGMSYTGHVTLAFYILIPSIVVSPALRFYREHFTSKHQLIAP